MSAQASLPTLDNLRSKIPAEVDVGAVAGKWLESFAEHVGSAEIAGLIDLFAEDALFRDILALTWDFRTFEGTHAIKKFLEDRLPVAKPTSFKLNEKYLSLQQPYPDVAWIQCLFEFETNIGIGSGVFRLIPMTNGHWKAHTVFTNLENLKGFPEKIGALRNYEASPGNWSENRKRETEFENDEPAVLIVGGGQCGLGLAARLKNLDVTSLVVEKQPRVGDQWRKRYKTLCLHDPVWRDHMPYLPFPPSWPVYTPAQKLADWLESYAQSLELNVWTSSVVLKASQDPSTRHWFVTVKRADGSERVLHPHHLVFAVGFGGGGPNMPVYPGMNEFEGQILHSSQYSKASDHAGKKAIVVGACNSGHDISADFYHHGIDVTMLQRGPTYVMTRKNCMPMLFGALYSEDAPPTDIADRISASFPNKLIKSMSQRLTKRLAEADNDLLDNLRKRGFKLTMGKDGTGFLLLALEKGGGYYIDVGASQLIADGKIKLKNDSLVERFTKTGIKFQNGSELPADVIVFATGYGDPSEPLRKVLDDELKGKCKPIWGLDDESEIRGLWRDMGIPHLWSMMGNLAYSRFHSKHLALQIKAIEEGVFGSRYASDAWKN
ncbi:hypothetical protein PILCRDRAFT_796588 [Piloderma croceum F 1598]|uniref:FAD/NAD(P)-binding domain-containing protein n=1 Tax=Piloderma croceum (strain F 1598) TaxID=765440 RepID=A0A0C3EWV2_PILCF|nr:hypothetical protein PILCRDRAFT_796588 [Piloderma croceum F 1598]